MWASHSGQLADWGHALIAADVVIDSAMNAVILDINTLSSFYHLNDTHLPTPTHPSTSNGPPPTPPTTREKKAHPREWPRWFVKERSATIRTALDIIEETAWRKIRDRRHRGEEEENVYARRENPEEKILLLQEKIRRRKSSSSSSSVFPSASFAPPAPLPPHNPAFFPSPRSSPEPLATHSQKFSIN